MKDKGISRIDSGSTQGYFVRGYRNGKTYSKLFSDRKLGGKKKALYRARAYRDELLSQLNSIPKQSQKACKVNKARRSAESLRATASRQAIRTYQGQAFAQVLRDYRSSEGINRVELALIAGITHSKIWEYEVNHRAPNKDSIHALASALKKSPTEFRKELEQISLKLYRSTDAKDSSNPA